MSARSSETMAVIGENKVSLERQRVIIRDQNDGHFVVFEPAEAEALRLWLAGVGEGADATKAATEPVRRPDSLPSKTLVQRLREDADSYHSALADKDDCWNVTAALEREAADALDGAAPETGVVYRKWPGEPPHCMSCDCGMTDEQKRTVPFEDYQTFHTALMAIVFESKSFTEAVKLASDALSHKPPSEKASEPRGPVLTRVCPGCNTVHSGPLCPTENGNLPRE